MRTATTPISRLCETWWEQLADATRTEHHRFALELLRLLGWDQPLPFSAQAEAEALSALPFVLRAGGQTTVVVYFVLPGTLEPPSAVIERGLDFCGSTRALTEESREMNVNYVLISDLYRSYLYDARTDELLLWADDPRGFEQDLGVTLKKTHVERGDLEAVRRPPRSLAARQLQEWRQHWQSNLESRAGLSETQSATVLDRLTVMRFLFEHDILRRTKWRLQQRFSEIEAQAWSIRPEGCGEKLVKLFHDMWFDWKMPLFEADPALDRALANDELVAALLRELGLLSRAKFSIPTVLESFNYGDPTEKMRVRMVPDSNEDRDAYLARQTLESIDDMRIEIDLAEEGYRAMLHWFDKVVALYERLSAEFDRNAHREAERHEELDLFAWSALDSNRPSACGDHIAHACELGFGVYYNSPQQYRVARLMLTLHIIARYHEMHYPLDEFPQFEKSLLRRPKILSAERTLRTLTPPSSGMDNIAARM